MHRGHSSELEQRCHPSGTLPVGEASASFPSAAASRGPGEPSSKLGVTPNLGRPGQRGAVVSGTGTRALLPMWGLWGCPRWSEAGMSPSPQGAGRAVSPALGPAPSWLRPAEGPHPALSFLEAERVDRTEARACCVPV